MLWVLGVIALGGLVLLLVLAMVSTPTLDPRDYGDHLDPELTGNAGVSELVVIRQRPFSVSENIFSSPLRGKGCIGIYD